MADNENDLDAFLSTGETKNVENNKPAAQQEVKPTENFSLEDEFTKLLNDFISQDSSSSTPSEPQQTATNTPNESMGSGLDGFMTQETVSQENGLDSFSSSPSEGDGLDSFASSSSEGDNQDSYNSPSESGGLDGFVSSESGEEQSLSDFQDTDSGELLDTLISPEEESAETSEEGGLKAEEQELARAITNFKDGVEAMASSKNLRMPQTDYNETMLEPNYKPSVGKKIAQYLLDCWDIINKYDPENMKRLSPEAGDEEYLSFAESLSDTYMQLAIISYVEILINLEICETSYEQKKELAIKNRIKRELYEEYMELQERKKLFIEKLKEKNFPIDADKLINNYFRAAQKDPDGSFEALTKNPAMFSPIQFEKMHPKFFGLIKVTPEDGIKANQKIGTFIKKLKV